MTLRRPTPVLVGAAHAAALAVPSAASAAAGGAGATGRSGAAPAPSGGTILRTARGALVRRAHIIRGSVAPGSAGRAVVVQVRARHGAWMTVGTPRAGARGGFSTTWTPIHLGRSSFRAFPAGQASVAAATAPSVEVTVFLPTRATYYGPGLFGHRTACGQTLTRHILGVAHRWLPCGTKVSLLYHGRTITVPVVDRGPFTKIADWDLTSATASALGMSSTSAIGAVSLRGDR